MRPQSAKYPSASRQLQVDNRPPLAAKPKLVNNLMENEDPFVNNNRSNSQKSGLVRPHSGYQISQNGLKKLVYQPMVAKGPPLPFQHGHQDSEKLQEDMRQLKLKLNELREENTKLKTKNMVLEKERVKYERVIQDIQMHGLNNNRMIQKLGTDANMVFTMKQSIKEMRLELDAKEDEIYKIKKAVKYTKIQEVEMEKKAFADETTRLRQIIEQLIEQRYQMENGSIQQQQMHNQLLEQNQMLVQMQETNNELVNTVQELEYQNQQLQELLQKTPDNRKADMQLQSLRQEVQLRDREIQQLKSQVQMLDRKVNSKQNLMRPQSGKPAQQSQQQQNQLMNEISYLQRELKAREDENEQLRQDMAEIEYYLEANGLLKSQVSSQAQERPKSLSEQRQVPTFMSHSDYQHEQREQKPQAAKKQKSRPQQLETSQNMSQYNEVDLDLIGQNQQPEYEEEFDQPEEVMEEDIPKNVDDNYEVEYEQEEFDNNEVEEEEVASKAPSRSRAIEPPKYSQSDYQMDLDSAKVDEYLNRDEQGQQSMSLKQHEDMDFDQVSDGPVGY